VTLEEICGAWGGCPLPRGHNLGQADVPSNHQPPGQYPWRIRMIRWLMQNSTPRYTYEQAVAALRRQAQEEGRCHNCGARWED
jgi:hypothetical protein